MRRERDDLAGASSLLYARRSKHDPANPGKSTTDQLDTQRARASRYGLNVVAEFTDDGIGASRHSAGKIRPGFVAAVEYLSEHPVEVFALWELSRATRRLRVYSDLMELCEDRGTYLLIGDRVYDPLDPTDAMVLGMNAVTDAAEVARIRERTLRGVQSTAAQGKPHGRNIYGYERVYDPRTRALIEVRPHPEQGPVVQELVARTIAGDSAHSITRDLNSRGLRKTSGALWHPSDVREMLTRPTYRGIRDHKGSEVVGVWPALITDEEWVQLRRVFLNRSRGVHDTTAKYLLTGVAMCRLCQKPMYVDSNKRLSYYHCHTCSRSRNAAYLEDYVVRFINGALQNPRWRQALAGGKAPVQRKVRAALDALRLELEEAYALNLSPRGLANVEARVLPQIELLEQQLLPTTAPVDLAGVHQLPDDPEKARRLLRSAVRVWVGPSRRGRGFDASSVQIKTVHDRPPADEL